MKKIINNFLEAIKLILKNKMFVVFLLSVVGVTNVGQYFFIPPHLHDNEVEPVIVKEVTHKTVINKAECGDKCKSDIQGLIRAAIKSHVKTEH